MGMTTVLPMPLLKRDYEPVEEVLATLPFLISQGFAQQFVFG